MRFLDRLQPLALLVLRAALGAVFIAHGGQKLFGGMKNFESIVSGIGVPWWMAYVVALVEFGGGILVLVGLLTRLAALGILADMCVAIAKVHWKNGLVAPQGKGYEFPLACAAIAFALIFFGAGPISLDWVTGRGGGPNQ